jgi:hypothetical protein
MERTKMGTSNTARRVVALRDAIRRSAKPRSKKPTSSFPTAEQLEQARARLQTLVHIGEADQVDGQLVQLLTALGIDPASPTAWLDGFLLLASLYCGVGTPRRTNTSAIKLSSADNMILLREMVQLMAQGLNEAQAMRRLAGDPSKAELLKLRPTSSVAQRVTTLRQRLCMIKNNSAGWEKLFGRPSITTVEKTLINLAVTEAVKNKPCFLMRS